MRKNKIRNSASDELRPEYDFSQMKGVRGKYYERYMAGTNLVLIEPDLYEVFRTGEAVNKALREVLQRRTRTRSSGNRNGRAVRKRIKARR